MTIVAVQLDIAWEDKRSNFAKVKQLCAATQISPGSLVCLPEMFATGFSMDAAKIAEPYGGETEVFLSQLASELLPRFGGCRDARSRREREE